MEDFSPHQSDSDASTYKDFSKVAHDLKSLKLWREQEAKQKLKEKIEREAQLAILEKEIRILKQKEENLHKKHRCRHGSYQSQSSTLGVSIHEDSLALGDHYQPPSRRTHRAPKVRESKVDRLYFHGKDDVEGYLDWEMNIEQIFVFHQVSEERKVSLTTLSFQSHAMYWWTSLVTDRRLHNEPPIQYWNELRSALRRRHIPSYYTRELMNKLQRLQQRHMSVEEYRQTMELYMMRAGIREEENITIARFLSGLNLEIRDKVELLPYRDLNDLVQLCIKVEQQVLRNFCSTRMVDKLGLTTTSHPKPYQLHWLNDDGDMVVHQQVEVEFSIENYKDKVTCDVVPMEAYHILLGRPCNLTNKQNMMALLTKSFSLIRVKSLYFILSHLNKWLRIKYK
uniref:Retrotransposon gag domain-containing protein n=1 Tax=Cajanus cajan TaxID=3821 RepID=A0A151SQC5_CAJCA|nr:hypothetical protein KK1_003193 [Cajanus cajan]